MNPKRKATPMTESLTPGDLRRHPVAQVLEAAAAGQDPNAAELDALGLPPETRRKVLHAANAAADIKAAGENAEARRHALHKADEIVHGLSPEQRDPDYLRVPEPEPTNPRDLAAQVNRI